MFIANKKNKILTTFILILLPIIWPFYADAARLYFTAPAESENNKLLKIGAIVELDEFINAIEGEIEFSPSLLKFNGFSDVGSIVPLWIEKPEADENGIIRFSGIIPGGIGPIVTKQGVLFYMDFQTLNEGTTELLFKNIKAYSNEAEPRQIQTSEEKISINIASLTENSLDEKKEPENLILDFAPPEPFQLFIAKNENFFDNKNVLIFSAQDKASGIDRYEINEKLLGVFGKPVVGESPYVLSHQSLFSIIEVKAVDKVGRETISRLIPPKLIYFYISLISIVFAIIFFLIVSRLNNRINKIWRAKK